MTPDNNTQAGGTDDDSHDQSRRNVLRLAGAGTGLAALGGMTMVGAGQEAPGTEPQNETAQVDDSVFVDDLIDPTFGYPLAADETGSVAIPTVVEADQLEGGVYENFPVQPGPDGGEFPIEFIFDPVGIQVAPEEVVHFLSVVGEHTVTAFSDKYANPEFAVPTRIPDETPGFSSPPLVDGESWLYQFTTKGVYDILCLPHYAFGMVMRVVVFDPEEDSAEDELFSVAPVEDIPPNAQAVLNAAELEPSNIVEQGSVAWEDLTLEPPQAETPGEAPNETSTEQS